MTIEIKPARFEEALQVFDDLRREDNYEVSRLGTPADILNELLDGSYSFVATVDGAVACVWGLRPGKAALDYPVAWLITGKLVDKYPIRLAKESIKILRDWLREFGVLECYVLESNQRSQRWLARMGFEASKPFWLDPVGTVQKFTARL